MRRLKYFRRLAGEFYQFAKMNKAWWILPMILILGLAGLLIVASQVAAPFLYPFF